MSIFYPAQLLANWLSFGVFGLAPKVLAGETVNFFIFDKIKVFLLLTVIIYAVSLIRTYLPPEKIRNILSHKNKFVGNILASLFGIILFI